MLTFPYSILKARSFRLDLLGQVISGGITAAGQQQRVNATGGGLWSLQMEFNRFTTPDQIKSWRVIQFGSQGGVVPVNVSICDIRQAPRPGGWVPSLGVPHSDGSPFSDSSLYASSTIVAEVVVDAEIRATTLRMSFADDIQPMGGEFFSLSYGDDLHEMHVILTVEYVTGDEFDVTFVPPLRSAYMAGASVNFDHPTGTFVLATADGMSMATEYGRWGTGTAAFVEYIAP